LHFIFFCALFGRKWKQHSHEEGLGIKPIIWLSAIKTQEKRSNDLWIHRVIWSWKVSSRGKTLFSRSIWSWFIYMGAPMLLLLQIIGFETMVLWLSNRFDLETHQKVNICIFTYKFAFCTRWAQFFYFSFIIYLIFGLGLVRRGELGALLWLVFLWLVWWLKEKSPLSKVWVDLMTISLMWS